MKVIDSIAGLEAATSEGKVAVLFHSERCPACKHFLPNVEEWSGDVANFKFFSISREAYLKERKEYFELADFPALAIFIDGKRQDVLLGTAPEQAFKGYFQAHASGQWKSREQLEQEQLEALDNYKCSE
jgi:thiol-disulfide isomerase/thioredoxin